MIRPLLLSWAVALVVLAPAARAQYTSSIFVGSGLPNGASATSVPVSAVNGMAVDSSGNLYLSSYAQNRVFKVTPAGSISTFAGNGIAGFLDNVQATSGQLSGPFGIALDSQGNLYIADTNNSRIRKVTLATGVISTVAGNGLCCAALGDGGLATNAEINPFGVAVDGSGNIYIADTNNFRIRKVTISTNIISTVAGTGAPGLFSGEGVPATNAPIGPVHHLAVDGPGNIYIADQDHQRIRKVTVANGLMNTVAGNDGSSTFVPLNQPDDVALDGAGNFYLMDRRDLVIRKVSSGGTVTTLAPVILPYSIASDAAGNVWVANNDYRIRKILGGVPTPVAGNGSYLYSGENVAPTSAQINPSGLTLDNVPNLYIADYQDFRIRRVAGGSINSVVGNGSANFSGDNGLAASAQVGNVSDIVFDSLGDLYIADHDNNRIRKVSGGIITTIAGNGTLGYSGDGGVATSATLRPPQGITVDNSGTVYFGDQNRIRKVSGGLINLVAGTGPPDGAPATSVSIQGYRDSGSQAAGGIAVDPSGNVYVADQNQHRVYKVLTNGNLIIVAGNGIAGYSGDGGPAKTAQLNSPSGVALDGNGNLYIADTNNCVIREVIGGMIKTVAGNHVCPNFHLGDGGPATSANVAFPSGVATDAAGNFYIADTNNNRVRKVTVATGIITSLAGQDGSAPGNNVGDGGPATSAYLASPVGVAIDGAGNVYIADRFTYSIRKITVATGIINRVAGITGTNLYAGDGPATSTSITEPYGIAVDGAGNFYFSDKESQRIRKVTVSTGLMSTVAGGGGLCAQKSNDVGDNCPPTLAILSSPQGVGLDSSGNVYIADVNNYRIRKASSTVITTIAGNGLASYSGDGGLAVNAQLSAPAALAVDNVGNLYMSDPLSNRVRVITTGGTINTYAGGGTQGLGDGGPPASASLSLPGGLAVDTAQNLYIVDRFNQSLRKVSGGIINTITTIPGLATLQFPTTDPYTPGAPNPTGVAVDGANRIYLSDPLSNGTVRLLTPTTNASLSIAKSHTGNFFQGQNGATYTITATNSVSAAPTNGTVTVTENIPAGLTLVLMSGTGWNCSSNICTRSNILTAGSSYPPITVTVNVAANAPSSVTNAVTLSGGGSLNANANDPTNIDARFQLTAIASPVGAGSIFAGSGFYAPNAGLSLQATPAGGFVFAGWTGNLSGTGNPQSLTMNGAKTVTANFSLVCAYTLGSTSATGIAGGGTGSVTITSNPSGCAYKVSTDGMPSWMHIISGSGNTTANSAITYSYDANFALTGRSGTFTVLDGNNFTISPFTLNQAAPCSPLILTPSTLNFGTVGGARTATFGPPCALPASWTASSNAAWVHVPASGTASSFTITVDDNSGGADRGPATITVNTVNPSSGPFFIGVTQGGQLCTFGIGTGSTSSGSAGFLSDGGNGSISVNVLKGQPPACSYAKWTAATPSASWLSLQFFEQFGDGILTYKILPNQTGKARTGTVSVAGLTYTINQAAIAQNYKCTQSPGISATPAAIRVEGEAELAGDLVFRTCDVAAPGGVTGDVVVTYNTAITNHRLSSDATGQTTDALLLLNEPNPTVFRGVLAGPNAIRFPSVPLAPANIVNFFNDWRITNVRVDATQLATLSPSNPTQVIGSISFVAPVELTVVKPTQVVANTQAPSLIFSKGSITNNSVTLTFAEGWANAFRNFAAETGYVSNALGGETGYPTNATRLLATVTNVPSGVTIYAPLVQASGPNAKLVSADSSGVGGFPQVGNFVSGGISYQQVTLDQTGSGTMTWEVIDSDPNTSQTLTFNVLVGNPGNASLGGIGISGNLAPQKLAGGPSATAPVPRFLPASQALSSLTVRLTGGVTASTLAFGNKSASQLAALGVHATNVGGTQAPTFELGNTGQNQATNVKVGATYPPSYKVSNCNASGGGTCTALGNTCSFEYPTMSFGERQLLTCSGANATSAIGGPYPYKTTVTSDSGNSDVNTSSFSANIVVPYVSIKTPPDGTVVSGFVNVTGLAIPINDSSGTAIRSLQVTVDDAQVGDLQKANFTLPDATCVNFTQYPNACPAGFAFVWNAAGAGNGLHKVCAIATGTDSDSDTSSACVNVTVGSASATISGQVTLNGSPLAGVLVSLSGAVSQSKTTDSSGNYSFPGLGLNVSYTITPTLQGYGFTPPSQTINSLGSDQVVNFTAGTRYLLTMAATNGSITANPTSSDGSYASGTTVQLTATPAAGYQFTGWSGDLSGNANPASIVMNATHSVTANFTTSSPLKFVAVTPCRFVDTRNANGPFGGPAITGQTARDFVIPNGACSIPGTAAAYSINVTVVPHGSLGYLTVYPTGQTRPLASTLNSDGRVKANAAIVSAGTGGAISIFVTDTTDVVLDINGYFVSPSGPSNLAFYPLTPCRVADTRNSTGSLGGPFLTGSQPRSFPVRSSPCSVPATAQAYSLNLTAVPRGTLGYITTYPAGGSIPLVSTLNAIGGQVTANAAIVPAGSNGDISVFAANDTDLVIDINGYFAPSGSGGLSLYNVTTCRVVDTRNPAGSAPFNGTITVNVAGSACAVPGAPQAYVFNATVVPSGLLGYLSLWPQGQSQPLVSTLNALDGAVSSNMAIVPTSNGSINAFGANPTQLILDITAYFAP